MKIKEGIELKFILKRMPQLHYNKNYNISQCYFIEDEKVVCYRGENKNNELKYFKLIQNKEENGLFEVSYEEISQDLFLEKYKISEKKISKLRYEYLDHLTSFEWKIDKFMLNEIVVAKLEKRSLQQDFSIPEEIKKVLIKEITGEYAYDSFNLSDNYENF